MPAAVTSDYAFVIRSGCLGRIQRKQPLDPLVSDILAFSNSKEKPFWQSEAHRKTYFDPSQKLFFKIAEEGIFAASCRKYFKYYQVLRKREIPTAEVVACLKIVKDKKKLSVIVTRQLEECRQFDHFLRSSAPEEQKRHMLEKLARLAVKIHKAGYYFSLDMRNMLVSAGEDPEIYLLDLEHMKPAGFFARRRISRNLKRFNRNLLVHTPGRTDYWDKFIETYNSHS